jgi:2-polyprenyl-3-methyl-5-hydroxy-6-metoxy-1,4-benzoquinol methylase/predicted transposase YbfD/YdcC
MIPDSSSLRGETTVLFGKQPGIYLDPAAGLYYPCGRTPAFFSDGSESKVMAAVRSASDVTSGSLDLLLQISDFTTRYHLSPERCCLLWPVRDLLKGRVLEVGAGCGALSRFLAENGADVWAMEDDSARAAICRDRCRGLSNVSVICGKLSDIPSDELFDAVLLVGVLEYGRVYNGGIDGPAHLLRKCRELLKPAGCLILAIENQLGLKYFAGAPEDHMGIPYSGIHDEYGPTTQVTFGKAELERLLDASGYKYRQFFFAFPDYKFPRAIVPERLLRNYDVNIASVLGMLAAPDLFKSYYRSFSEELAWPVVLRNGLAEDLANSFLAVASASGSFGSELKTSVSIFSSFRRKPFAKVTLFDPEHDAIVSRQRLYPDTSAPDGVFEQRIESEPLYRGKLLIEDFVHILNKTGWTEAEIAYGARPWLEYLRGFVFSSEDRPKSQEWLPGEFMDCIPANLARDEAGTLQRFDQEWISREPVPLTFVLFRGLLDIFLRVQSVAPCGPVVSTRLLDLIERIVQRLGIPCDLSEVEAALERELAFQESIVGLGGNLRAHYSGVHISPPRVSDPRTEIQSLENQLSEVNRVAAEAVQSLNTTRAELHLARVEIEQLRATEQEVRSEADQLRASLGEARNEMQAFRTEAHELRDEAKTLRAEVRGHWNQIHSLTVERDTAVHERNNQAARSHELATELAATRQHALNLEQQLKNVQQSGAWRVGLRVARIWRSLSLR